jgi:outer membrane protein assembly factor BamD (BamD/ComL family)
MKLKAPVMCLLLAGIFFIPVKALYAAGAGQAAELYEQGVKQYKTGEYYPAMDTFMQVLILKPKDARAGRYLKASADRILEQERREINKESEMMYSRARKALSEKGGPEDIKKLYTQGIKNYRKGNYLWATDKLARVADIDSGYGNVQQYLAEIRARMDNVSRQDTLPDTEKYYYARGYVTYYGNNLSETVSSWGRVLAVNPSDKEIKEYYEKTKWQLKMKEESERIEKLVGEVNEIYARGIQEYNDKVYVDALNEWDEVLRKTKDEPDPRLVQLRNSAISDIERTLKDLKKIATTSVKPVSAPAAPAAKPVEEVVVIDAGKAEEYYRQGLLSYAHGFIRDAVRMWTLALRYDPTNKKISNAMQKAEAELGSK